MKNENVDGWTQFEDKKHVLVHDDTAIQVMVFTNDFDEDIKCVWVKINHDNEFLSEYFVFSESKEEMSAFDFALKMVEKFKDLDRDE